MVSIPDPLWWWRAQDTVRDSNNGVTSWPSHEGRGPTLLPDMDPLYPWPMATYEKSGSCPAIVFAENSTEYRYGTTGGEVLGDFSEKIHVFARWKYNYRPWDGFYQSDPVFFGYGGSLGSPGGLFEVGGASSWAAGYEWVASAQVGDGPNQDHFIERQFSMPLNEVVVSDWEYEPLTYRTNGNAVDPTYNYERPGAPRAGFTFEEVVVRPSSGELFELLVYDRNLTTEQAQSVRNYLARSCGGCPPMRQRQLGAGSRSQLLPLRQRQNGSSVYRARGDRF